MFRIHRFPAALLAVSLFFAPSILRADEDKPADKAAAADKAPDKAAEKAPPAEVTTQGTVEVGGQHIAYTAIAGTLTVGSTDVQDAQLGLDGKPQPAVSLPYPNRRSRRMQPLLRECFTWLTSKGPPTTGLRRWGRRRTRRPRTVPLPSFTMVDQAVRLSGCTWARSVPSTWSPVATSTCPPRLINSSTTPTRCSIPATWFSSICPAPASGGSQARTRTKPSGAWMRTPTLSPASSPGSSPGTTAGIRPSTSLAKATAPRAPRCSPTFWRITRTST